MRTFREISRLMTVYSKSSDGEGDWLGEPPKKGATKAPRSEIRGLKDRFTSPRPYRQGAEFLNTQFYVFLPGRIWQRIPGRNWKKLPVKRSQHLHRQLLAVPLAPATRNFDGFAEMGQEVPTDRRKSPERSGAMSGVGPSGVVVGATVAATGAATGKAAGALLPFTGIAFGVYIAIAVSLVIAGLVLRRVATKRS